MVNLLKLKGKALFNASTAMAGVGFLLFGYDQGVMSGVVANQNFKEYMGMGTPETYNSALLGAIVALYEIGCMAGALSTGKVGDWLGRRKTIRLGCLILCVGAVIQTASINVGMMIFARIFTGIGNGLNTATIPVYQAELSPPKNRGAHVSFEASLLAFGVGIAYWLEFGLYFVNGEFPWRFPLAFQMVFGIILFVGTYFLPESPRWLQSKDREEDCKMVLARLWTDEDTTHPRCIAEWEEIRDGIELERREGIRSYKELFSKGRMNNRYRVLLGMGGQIMQQFGGINVISYYLTDIFLQAGMSHAMAMLMAGVDSIFYFLGALTPIYTIDRYGRRALMYAGLIGQAVTLIIVGATQYCVERGDTRASPAVIVFVILYNAIFGAAWLGLAWLYPSEIFPTALRAKGNSMSTGANWLGNFVVAMIAPVLFEYAKYWTFLMFGILNVIFLVPIYLWYPETNGKSLEEIEVLFATDDLKADARSIAPSIGNSSALEEKHDVERASRVPSIASRPGSVAIKEAPTPDSDAGQVKQEYDEKTDGPNYK
ncbi:general substrate transporter [Phascolomyces articulosus]|uniref:General substrate transporter n=1 Tax=Phascolomyces articulosus TaxID=60185 RepID=A0AAD5PG09_9FUNG|nr:general substrate transporter [Phascolomyces articulosus]